jgi:hypothetical protein
MNVFLSISRRGNQGQGQRSGMAPPPSHAAPAIHPSVREVTEDTPPDLLEGTMDLLVVLPSKTTLRMTVNRRWIASCCCYSPLLLSFA